MSDGETDDRSDPTTREFVSLVFLNPISLVGIVLTVAGAAYLSLSDPSTAGSNAPLLGGGAMLVGAFVFALGFSKAQRDIVAKAPDWSFKNR